VSELTEKDIQEAIEHIKRLSHIELAKLWRSTPIGHPYLNQKLPIFPVFKERFFDHFGGFTPKISEFLSMSPKGLGHCSHCKKPLAGGGLVLVVTKRVSYKITPDGVVDSGEIDDSIEESVICCTSCGAIFDFVEEEHQRQRIITRLFRRREGYR
jgi:hypothetical protein